MQQGIKIIGIQLEAWRNKGGHNPTILLVLNCVVVVLQILHEIFRGVNWLVAKVRYILLAIKAYIEHITGSVVITKGFGVTKELAGFGLMPHITIPALPEVIGVFIHKGAVGTSAVLIYLLCVLPRVVASFLQAVDISLYTLATVGKGVVRVYHGLRTLTGSKLKRKSVPTHGKFQNVATTKVVNRVTAKLFTDLTTRGNSLRCLPVLT